MHAATGHCILSFLSEEARQRVVDRWQRQTGEQIPADLEPHLRTIAKNGFEERESYEIKGVINISYPVLDERRQAVAALTVPYLARIGETVPLKTVRAVLQQASRSLSTEMGCPA
jgi:DNA-binding IclR family transcriptional regulator